MAYKLKSVENFGELQGDYHSEDLAVSTSPIFADMEKQLNAKPIQFKFLVGWKTYVWEEEETGEIKQLTEGEFQRLYNEGTLNYSRDDDGSSEPVADATGDEASDTQ